MAKKKTAKKKTAKKKTAKKKTAKKKTAKKKTAKKKTVEKHVQEVKAKQQDLLKSRKFDIQFLPVAPEISYARAEKALRTEVAKFENQPGKIFFDVGRKFTNGRPQRDFALRMHVDNKAEPGPHCMDKTCLDGLVPTDVIQSNFIQAVGDSDSGAKIRSNGNPGEFGTLGLGVTALGTGVKFLLTCAHVLTDSFPPQIEDVLEQDTDILGFTGDNFQLLYRFNDELDAGIFFPHSRLSDGEIGQFDRSALPTNAVTPFRIDDPSSSDVFGQPDPTIVYKIGANDAAGTFTEGYIDAVSLDRAIPITNGPFIPGTNPPRRPNASTDTHFLVRSAHNPGHFAEPGDSGAVVLTGDGRILGMIRAVSENAGLNPQGHRAVVTKMTTIRSELELMLL